MPEAETLQFEQKKKADVGAAAGVLDSSFCQRECLIYPPKRTKVLYFLPGAT
jgi:hypothetical protein